MIVVSVCLPSDALSQHLLSYLGIFYLGHGVCIKAKWLSGEALPIAVKRREDKSKGENERYLKAEFQRIARRDKKAFLVIDAKK